VNKGKRRGHRRRDRGTSNKEESGKRAMAPPGSLFRFYLTLRRHSSS
jgi:hypothetical protein